MVRWTGSALKKTGGSRLDIHHSILDLGGGFLQICVDDHLP